MAQRAHSTCDAPFTILGESIALQGEMILLDESFTGFDVKTETKIISLLRELRAEGKTMLVSMHNPRFVTAFCDELSKMPI